MTCLQTHRLKFLDVRNFIASDFNYSPYLKGFGGEQQKKFFSYRWMDDLTKLDYKRLPKRECFRSRLVERNLAAKDYDVVEHAWAIEGMCMMRDLPIWYNNLDVKLFPLALEKQSHDYRERGIKMLKRGLSESMRTFSERNHHLVRLQRSLVSSMKGEKMFFTDLLKWCLECGIIISSVRRVVEYLIQDIFRPFTSSFTDARREGDIDSPLELLDNTAELIGNSL